MAHIIIITIMKVATFVNVGCVLVCRCESYNPLKDYHWQKEMRWAQRKEKREQSEETVISRWWWRYNISSSLWGFIIIINGAQKVAFSSHLCSMLCGGGGVSTLLLLLSHGSIIFNVFSLLGVKSTHTHTHTHCLVILYSFVSSVYFHTCLFYDERDLLTTNHVWALEHRNKLHYYCHRL